MKRNELTEAVRKASEAAGYAFYSGLPHLIDSEVRLYPAAWFEPPVAVAATGRGEGEIVYLAVIHLMSLPSAAGELQSIPPRLETDALSIARQLMTAPSVCGVSKISCTPAAQSLSLHGEISATLECEVTVWFRA